jgi:hypothetical protein
VARLAGRTWRVWRQTDERSSAALAGAQDAGRIARRDGVTLLAGICAVRVHGRAELLAAGLASFSLPAQAVTVRERAEARAVEEVVELRH